LGFRREAFIRWQRAFPVEKDGRAGRDGECIGTAMKKGRDTIMLAICWDDWEEGVREKVAGLVEREP